MRVGSRGAAVGGRRRGAGGAPVRLGFHGVRGLRAVCGSATVLHALWSKELWLKDAWTRIDRLYWSRAGLGYDVRPWLSVGADYTFIAVRRTAAGEYRNRGNADVTFRYAPAVRWRLSLRERVRVTSANRPPPIPARRPTPPGRCVRALRSSTGPHVPHGAPTPRARWPGTLNAPPDAGRRYVERIRTTLGVKWALSARSRLDLFLPLRPRHLERARLRGRCPAVRGCGAGEPLYSGCELRAHAGTVGGAALDFAGRLPGDCRAEPLFRRMRSCALRFRSGVWPPHAAVCRPETIPEKKSTPATNDSSQGWMVWSRGNPGIGVRVRCGSCRRFSVRRPRVS